MISKRLDTARIILAVMGLIISIYLAASADLNLPVTCPNGQVINCGKVLNSLYAQSFGIPNTYYGILFFLLVLALAYIKKQELLALLSAIGMGFVFYFLYAEYQLGAICIYCTGVHIVTLAIFAISVFEISRSTDANATTQTKT